MTQKSSTLTEEFKVQLFLRNSTGLVKEIGPFGSFLLPWLSIAGSGISVYAIQVIYYYPEGSVPLCMLILAIPCVLSLLTFALMGIMTPRAAGAYVWTSRVLDPFVGWFGAGWLYWMCGFVTIGLIGYVFESLIPVMFIIIGQAVGIPGLVSFATAMESNVWMQGEVITAIILICTVVNLVEVKYFMRVLMALWAMNCVGLVVSMALFAVNNPTTIPAAWNNVWGAGSYQMIVNLATKYNLAGYVATTTGGFWSDTLSMCAFLFWALIGWEINSYVGGEVRNPRSSFLYFYTAGFIATAIWYVLVSFLAYNAYGGFILQYNYVYQLFQAGKLTATESAAVSPYMLLPSMPLFSASLAGPTAVRVLAAWWFWPLTGTVMGWLGCTRSMFGMAFDRMFPAVFGKVNERSHTPLIAILFTTIGGLIIALIDFSAYGYMVSASNSSFWFAFVYVIVAFTAIILPYKRPDMWEKGTRRRIFGIPDLTFIGALATMGMLWLLTLSTIGINLLAWNVSLVYMIIGILVFVYYAAKNERRGINISRIYGEIPPP